jgi:hypothetical protein
VQFFYFGKTFPLLFEHNFPVANQKKLRRCALIPRFCSVCVQ